MIIFGTVGIVRKLIPLPTPIITMARGIFGFLGFLCLMLVRKQSFTLFRDRKTFCLVLLTGLILGVNMLAIYEAYSYISVSTATVYGYLAPFIAILLSPMIVHEKLSLKAVLCGCVAMLGIVLISGHVDLSFSGRQIIGVALSLAAAFLNALVMLLNKKTADVPAEEKLLFEMGMVFIVAGVNAVFTIDMKSLDFSPRNILFLMLTGLFHSCIGYYLYFAAMKGLTAQTIAIMNYITPVVILVLANVVLHETFSFGEIIGAVLIIGSALIHELPIRKTA